MKPFILLITLLFILSGCVAHSEILKTWVGKNQDELISSWGAPDKTFIMSDSKTVLTWEKVYGDGNGIGTCTRSFIIEQNGIIEKWSYQGCPNYFLKLP